MYEALPLDGERECGTMPQRSPSEGVLATLKGTTPGDLEGDLPCDPGGEENVESKRACKASEDDVACFDAPNNLKALTWPPKESVGWHNRNETTTHLHQSTIVSSRCRGVDPFSSLRSIDREGTHAVLVEVEVELAVTLVSRAVTHIPTFFICSRSPISSTMSTSSFCRRPLHPPLYSRL